MLYSPIVNIVAFMLGKRYDYHMPSSAELVRMTAKIHGSLKGELVHLEG